MKVCILTPTFDILKSGYGTKAKAKFGYWPPLGPGFLSAAIKKNPGVEVTFIDGAAERMSTYDVVMDQRINSADIVMLSVLTANKDSAYSLVKEIRKDYPDRFISAKVWGKSAKFPGQSIGLDHRLLDKDIVELHLK